MLGFDVILDHNLKPYILEVNHAASFATDSPLDKKIKLDLMKDTFTMLRTSALYRRQPTSSRWKCIIQYIIKQYLSWDSQKIHLLLYPALSSFLLFLYTASNRK